MQLRAKHHSDLHHPQAVPASSQSPPLSRNAMLPPTLDVLAEHRWKQELAAWATSAAERANQHNYFGQASCQGMSTTRHGIVAPAPPRPAGHVRGAWATALAVALTLLVAGAARGGSSARVELAQGRDGEELDLSTLPRAAETQDLARGSMWHGISGHGQYDALLSNGPLSPPRAKTIHSLATQALATMRSKMGGGAAKAPSRRSGDGIGLGGKVHLLRSARQILAGRMAGALTGAKQHATAPTLSKKQKEIARAEWRPRAKKTLQQTEAALEAKVRKLEGAAGDAEISELAGLSSHS